METLSQIAKRIRAGLKASQVEGVAFSVRVRAGMLCIEVTQVRSGFKVLREGDRYTPEAIAWRAQLEAYARSFTQPFDTLQVQFSHEIIRAERARLAGVG